MSQNYALKPGSPSRPWAAVALILVFLAPIELRCSGPTAVAPGPRLREPVGSAGTALVQFLHQTRGCLDQGFLSGQSCLFPTEPLLPRHSTIT